jgi:regulator of PEP synthase PpsR (kinase-PPPase family)
MDAIEYSLKCDDGKNINNIGKADIILIGPSRVSKTPTSVYLAYNGFKTANIPYVLDIDLPDIIFSVKKPLIACLLIEPSRLEKIRLARVNLINNTHLDSYTNIDYINLEYKNIRRICNLHNWPIINASNKSVEETSSIIMKHYYNHISKLKLNN